MELSGKFQYTLESLKSAVGSFEKSLEMDFSNLDLFGIDLIKNGRIQKFEYCTELAWKVGKMFIELRLGIINNSPKTVYRTLFTERLIDEKLLISLLKAIDDRNQLSHIYREEMYGLIYADLPEHLAALKALTGILSAE